MTLRTIVGFLALLLAAAAIGAGPAFAQTPTDPAPSVEPDAPSGVGDDPKTKPDKPKPDKPKPDEPDAEPEAPQPDTPEEPDTPDEPYTPPEPDTPAEPDTPDEPDTPAEPKPDTPGQPEPDKGSGRPAPEAARPQTPTLNRSTSRPARGRPGQSNRAQGDGRAFQPSASRPERRLDDGGTAGSRRRGRKRASAEILQRALTDVAAGTAPRAARPAATTPPRRPRPARDVAGTISFARAADLPRMLDGLAGSNGMLLLVSFLLASAYAGGLWFLVRQESWSRRRSGTAALVSRRRAARRLPRSSKTR